MAVGSAADLRDDGDAQPLAFRRPTGNGSAGERLLSASNTHAHDAMARPLSDRRHGPSVPRPIQGAPVQDDEHLLAVMRYVERNPLRAGLVDQAEAWRWSSAFARRRPQDERPWLATPKVRPLPRQWRARVNKPQTKAEVAAIRKSVVRGSPFGDNAWTKSSVARLGLERTMRSRGRPKKQKKES